MGGGVHSRKWRKMGFFSDTELEKRKEKREKRKKEGKSSGRRGPNKWTKCAGWAEI